MPRKRVLANPLFNHRHVFCDLCLLYRSGQYLRRYHSDGRRLRLEFETQGYILSSFYIGYLLMQIGGGRLADTFGGKVVLGAGVLIWSFLR